MARTTKKQLIRQLNTLRRAYNVGRSIYSSARKRRTRTRRTRTNPYSTPQRTPNRSRNGMTGVIYTNAKKKQKVNFRSVNVKNDVDGNTRTYYKTKCTTQQQKKINRRFKDENNLYTQLIQDQIVDTVPQTTNTCKWIWSTHNTLVQLNDMWARWINPTGTVGELTEDNPTASDYRISGEQAIYFHTFKTKYEIFNPTNYDMHLVIYDIITKKDTQHTSSSFDYNKFKSTSPATRDDPITLMSQGLTSVSNYPSNWVSVPGFVDIKNIQTTPTMSYKFNIHYTVVGKKTITLQPGATMYHTFTYKPKNLMTRGYWGYSYRGSSAAENIAIENFTCGSLFKYWGQLSGETITKAETEGETTVYVQDNPDAVVNLSGRIMIKEFCKYKWYCMQPKASFTRFVNYSTYTPDDEEQLIVVNDDTIKTAEDDAYFDGDVPQD